MGDIYKPSCSYCNRRFSELFLGYGMASSMCSGFYVPCTCNRCKRIITCDFFTKAQTFKKQYRCPRCNHGVQRIGEPHDDPTWDSYDGPFDSSYLFESILWDSPDNDGTHPIMKTRPWSTESKTNYTLVPNAMKTP